MTAPRSVDRDGCLQGVDQRPDVVAGRGGEDRQGLIAGAGFPVGGLSAWWVAEGRYGLLNTTDPEEPAPTTHLRFP